MGPVDHQGRDTLGGAQLLFFLAHCVSFAGPMARSARERSCLIDVFADVVDVEFVLILQEFDVVVFDGAATGFFVVLAEWRDLRRFVCLGDVLCAGFVKSFRPARDHNVCNDDNQNYGDGVHILSREKMITWLADGWRMSCRYSLTDAASISRVGWSNLNTATFGTLMAPMSAHV